MSKRTSASGVQVGLVILLFLFKIRLNFVVSSLAIVPPEITAEVQTQGPSALAQEHQFDVAADRVPDGDKQSSAARSDLGRDPQPLYQIPTRDDTEISDGSNVVVGVVKEPPAVVTVQPPVETDNVTDKAEVNEEAGATTDTAGPVSKQPFWRQWWPTTPRSATISDQDTGAFIDNHTPSSRNNEQQTSADAETTEVDKENSTVTATTEAEDLSSVRIVEEGSALGENECILGSSDVYLAWWINNDGSLRKTEPEFEYDSGQGVSVTNFIDMSGLGRNEVSLFYKLLQRLNEKRSTTTDIPIKFLSLARNNLDRAPYSSLNLIGKTLEYLSLAGNNFGMLNASTIKDDFEDWATFPQLELLKELDLRSCKIAYIQEDSFGEMRMLQKMYLSGNHLVSLSTQVFAHVRSLVHLDLSHNSIEYTLTNFNANPFEWFTRGLEIEEFAFAELPQLKFLDFSHTRLEPASMKSFAHLPSNLEQLSLCYTAITVIGLGMFHNLPNLKVLDLSGNSALTANMNQNTFDGLQNSLEILAFENSSVKHLDWLGNLNSLKMLKLNDNNINQLTSDTFQTLPSLDVLDLSFNHVGNWFNRVFEANTGLRILNLRSNNLNMITPEMMNDFSPLEYLGLGDNNFICNCMLRDLLDQALQNTNPPEGQGYTGEVPNIDDLLVTQVLINYLNNIGLEQSKTVGRSQGEAAVAEGSVYDSYRRVLREYVSQGLESYNKIRSSVVANADAINTKLLLRAKAKLKVHYISASEAKRRELLLLQSRSRRSLNGSAETTTAPSVSSDFFYTSAQEMDFDFQLLDFEEKYYTCFNATSNEEYFFTELESCLLERVAGWQNLVAQLRPHQQRVSVLLYVVFVAMVILCVGYYKWWYIRYFFILIKNATILSFLNKEATQENGARKSFGEISRDDVYMYDVFVSYCDENRDWVIDELLPNIEQREEISICLHERDFLVGLSILENIIACMDRSKCLLLVVSQSFLLSQWCQFEMHLAQHRLLETCRERLVLILLEDIPKRKRPKTLGYLMKTKTYIKWPLAANYKENSRTLGEERKVFWKRLRRALIDTDWEADAKN